MDQLSSERNPFMLMLNPEVILAAVEKSERLGQLNRHLCRPLDRPAPVKASALSGAAIVVVDEDDEGDSEDDLSAP